MKKLIKNKFASLRNPTYRWLAAALLILVVLNIKIATNPAGNLATNPAINSAQGAERLSKESFAKLSAYKYLPMGSPSAKVTVYEFFSLTCSHCASFHKKSFPKIKKKYIDSGKIKWQMIDFPLDNTAYGAAVLARCITNRNAYNGFLNTLLEKQNQWITKDPKAAIISLMARAGVNDKAAKVCLKNKKNLAAVLTARELGNAIGVNSTPTFFVMDQAISNNEKKLIKAINKALK